MLMRCRPVSLILAPWLCEGPSKGCKASEHVDENADVMQTYNTRSECASRTDAGAEFVEKKRTRC